MASNSFRVKKSLHIKPETSPSLSEKGDIAVNDSTNKVSFHNGTSTLSIVTDTYSGNVAITGRVSTTSSVLVGTSSAASASAYIDLVKGSAGVDTGVPHLRIADITTDITAKQAAIGWRHTTNAEKDHNICYASGSELSIGGGISALNAPTLIKFFTGATSTSGAGTEAMRINSSGNVGIGLSPTVKLEVDGRIKSGKSTEATPLQVIRDTNSGDSTDSVSITVGNSGSSQGLAALQFFNDGSTGSPAARFSFQPRNNANSASFEAAKIILTKSAGADTATIDLQNTAGRIFLNATGKVGIGTSGPSEALDISTSGDSNIKIASATANSDVAVNTVNDVQTWKFGVFGSDSDKFKLQDGSSSDKLVVDVSGKVGIGTSSPAADKLHVLSSGTAGTPSLTQSFAVQNSGAAGTGSSIAIVAGNTGLSTLDFGDTDSSSDGQIVYNNSNQSLSFKTATSERARLTSSGALLVGTSTASAASPYIDYVRGTAGVIAGTGHLRLTDITTDTSSKQAAISWRHTTNAEEDHAVIYASGSELNIGGGVSALNSVTALKFFTGATSTTTTGAESLRIDSSGQISARVVGAGFSIKEGSNAKMGTATLVAGSIVVSTTAITASSRVFLTSQVDGGTPGFLRVSSRNAGTDFTITSSNGGDTSTVAWVMFEPS